MCLPFHGGMVRRGKQTAYMQRTAEFRKFRKFGRFCDKAMRANERKTKVIRRTGR